MIQDSSIHVYEIQPVVPIQNGLNIFLVLADSETEVTMTDLKNRRSISISVISVAV